MPPSKTKTKIKPKEKTPVVDVKEDSSDEDLIALTHQASQKQAPQKQRKG
jgi:hypothetical protein